MNQERHASLDVKFLCIPCFAANLNDRFEEPVSRAIKENMHLIKK